MSKQQEIPGTEIPKDPNIEYAIDKWLEAQHAQRNASEDTKLAHAALVLHMQNAGVEAYPYVDPKTGKKKQIVIKRDPKAKKAAAPRKNRRHPEVEAEVGEEVKDKDADKVETRRVKRSQVKNADAIVDPFAATRASMSETEH